MPGTKPNTFSQLAAIWSRLQPNQRATIILFGVLALGGLGTFVYFMNRVEYVVLYRDLNPEDTQAIAEKLRELKRDFHVSSDGSTIEVGGSQTDIDKLRVEISATGLARSGSIGYEIFDKNQFGMTDFTEQVNYKRAIEGELSRTISSISEVLEARVHLVLPKDSLFEDKKETAKASVFVRLKRGQELSKNSIGGIVNLVAGAVQGLRTENVSVVDEKGKVLSRISAGDGVRSDYETGYQAQLEKEMIAKVTSILEPVVGTGKVHANASVDLDFNSSEQTEETYNPTPPPVILSQQKSEERVGGSGATAGVPGTRSNQGGVDPQAIPAPPDRSRQSEVTNYEVSKLWRHTVQPKGSVRRISVAVLLDHKALYSKGDDGKTMTSFEPRSKEELDAYRELVLAAIGYDESRGDTVTLENIPFFSEPAVEEINTPLPWYVKWQPYLLPAMKYAAFLVLFLIAYLLMVRPVRKRVLQSLAVTPAALPPGKAQALGAGEKKPVTAGQGGHALPAGNPGQATDALDAEIEQELLRDAEEADAGFRKYDVLKKKVMEHASKEPEQVSQLIRAWIHEKP